MLSNSNYKMMDIYPTKYKTMTSVNDELKLAGMTRIKIRLFNDNGKHVPRL